MPVIWLFLDLQERVHLYHVNVSFVVTLRPPIRSVTVFYVPNEDMTEQNACKTVGRELNALLRNDILGSYVLKLGHKNSLMAWRQCRYPFILYQ